MEETGRVQSFSKKGPGHKRNNINAQKYRNKTRPTKRPPKLFSRLPSLRPQPMTGVAAHIPSRLPPAAPPHRLEPAVLLSPSRDGYAEGKAGVRTLPAKNFLIHVLQIAKLKTTLRDRVKFPSPPSSRMPPDFSASPSLLLVASQVLSISYPPPSRPPKFSADDLLCAPYPRFLHCK